MNLAMNTRMFNFPNRLAHIFFLLTIAVVTACAQEATTLSSTGDRAEGDLIESVKQGQLEQVIALLASGVSPDSTDSDGNTPLCWAVRVNRLDIVETLIASKASVDLEEEDGTTALDVAAASGRADFVKLLLAQGANPNHKDNCGHTTLISAAMGAMIKSLPPLIVTELVSDEDIKDLIPSMGFEHRAVAKILLEAGADPNVVAEDCGLTALKIAAMSGDAELARVLFSAKIKLTQETRADAVKFLEDTESGEELQLVLDLISDKEQKQKLLNWYQSTSLPRREISKMLNASEKAHSTR